MNQFKEISGSKDTLPPETTTQEEPSAPSQSCGTSLHEFSSSWSLSAIQRDGFPINDPTIATKVASLVNQDDMEGLKKSQDFLSDKLIKTTDRLREFNQFSSTTLQNQQWKFEQHTRLLVDLHKDLTAISNISRNLKQKLAKQYPEQYSEAVGLVPRPKDPEDEE